jgi:hypothetical protein
MMIHVKARIVETTPFYWIFSTSDSSEDQHAGSHHAITRIRGDSDKKKTSFEKSGRDISDWTETE